MTSVLTELRQCQVKQEKNKLFYTKFDTSNTLIIDTMLWLNKAFMCCLANTLSVISFASKTKNKSLFTEQLG